MVRKKKHASDTRTDKGLYYFADMRMRCNIAVATEIRVRLRPGSARLELFRGTCFGPWLDVKSTSKDACLVHLILQTEYTPVVHQDALFFRVGGQELRFGPQEFCLITGLRFGPRLGNKGKGDMTFRERVFGHVQSILRVSDLKNVFDHSLDQLSDLDAVRLCLLILVEIGFMGCDHRMHVDRFLLELVEDLDSWNTFPWGSYLWDYVYKRLHNALSKRCALGTNLSLGYALSGFIWAFKIWIFEVFPYARNFAIKHSGIPRAVSWGKNRCITWKLALPFVMDATMPGYEPLSVLTPTPAECATDWWRASHQYFDAYANDCSLLSNKARLSSPPQQSLMVRDKLAEDHVVESYYLADLRMRCSIAVAIKIRKRLTPGSARLELFRSTCFRPWLDVQSTSNDASLVHLILQTEYTPPDGHQEALFFRVGGQELRFGPQEFCLITGLRFGPCHWNKGRTDMMFRERVFGHVQGRLRVSDLKNVFDHSLDQLSDLDAVRLCLLMLVEVGFMGRSMRTPVDLILLELVEDLDSWNTFPWGSYVWELVYKQLHNALAKRSAQGNHMPLGYELTGFIWAFKIWIFEVFPYARNFATKRRGNPRAICWGKNRRCMTWKLALPFVMDATMPEYEPLSVLTPTPAECATDWWKASRQYFDSYANDCFPLSKKARLSSPPQPSVMACEKLVEGRVVGRKVSSQSKITCVRGYRVKKSVAPILESIYKKHGDVAAERILKPASMRSSFLEMVCEVVSRLQTDNIGKMEDKEQQVLVAEAANIGLLMEMKTNTGLVKKAALMDLRETCVDIMDAQEWFVNAERCVRVLHLVEKNLNDSILESIRSSKLKLSL